MPSSKPKPPSQTTTFQVEVTADNAAITRLSTEGDATLWVESSPEEVRAMESLVATALDHMRTNIAEWLPHAITAQSHSRFAVVISWEFGMVHEEVLRRRVEAESDRSERVADLLRMTQTTSE